MHTLLFTDVENSTRFHEAFGDERAAAVWTAHDRRSRDLLARHGGREIGRADGLFLLFDRTADAASYALEYRAALAELGLSARVGIHAGAVTLRANAASDIARGANGLEIDGIATPIAARIMALARGGQILMSAAARAALAADVPAGAAVVAHGHYQLKGIESPLEIHELGVRDVSPFVPPADVDKAYRVVRDGDLWRPVREVRHNLPPERDAFVGRGMELRELAQRLSHGARLVTILGPGGMGKTRLARRYGSAWLGDWPGGVYFCDLSDARSIEGIASATASALAVPLGRHNPVVQLSHVIAGRGRCLVVLDNFEQVVAHAPATLSRWLDAAPAAAFVVTSRERLQLPGEQVLAIEPLALDGDAIDLFVERARAQRPAFVLDEANRTAVAEVVRLLDGLPLAIELAAARVSVFSPGELALRMRDRFKWLGGMRGASQRQATLLAAIDWSWALLTAWEQAALAQCSTFDGAFALEAAEAVVDVASWPQAPPVADVVQALCDKSLLRASVQADPSDVPLFAMYLGIREYAAGKLASYGPVARRATEERHGAYFARFGSEDAIETLDGREGVDRRRALTQKLDNLLLACRRAIDRGDAAQALNAVAAAWPVLELQGPIAPVVDLYSQTIAMSGLRPRERARATWLYGAALRRMGRLEEAGQALEAALTLLHATPDPRIEGWVLQILTLLRADQGQMREARSLAERALAAARASGNVMLEGAVRNCQGIIAAEDGRYDDARANFDAALALHRSLGDRRAEGIDSVNIATVCMLSKRTEEASGYFERALAIHREVGDRRSEGFALANLGKLHADESRLQQAQECCERALAIDREVGNRFAESTALADLGEIYLMQERLDDAEIALRDGETLLREVDEKSGLARVLCNRARLCFMRNDRDGAHALLTAAEAIVEALGVGPESEARRRLAQVRALLN